MAVYGVKSQQN